MKINLDFQFETLSKFLHFFFPQSKCYYIFKKKSIKEKIPPGAVSLLLLILIGKNAFFSRGILQDSDFLKGLKLATPLSVALVD